MAKKILILTPRFPYPLTSGDKVRIYNICKYLAQTGYQLTLLSFIQNQAQQKFITAEEIKSVFSLVHVVQLPKWRSYLNSFFGLGQRRPLQLSYYAAAEMNKLVDKELATSVYDNVIVHLIRMAPYVMNKNGIGKILEMTDALSMTYERSRQSASKGLLSQIYKIEEKRVKNFESECLKNFDFVVVASERDKEQLLKNSITASSEKIKIIPNGVSENFLRFQPTGIYDLNLIVFIGNLRSLQNQDAVFYFIKSIYPLIKQKRPQARFRIIGSNPPKSVLKLAGKNEIEVTGPVENVIDWIAQAGVAVAPMRIVAGSQIKILETMALGIPTVTTTVSASGIKDATAGKHFLVADQPAEFAQAVIKLMTDKNLRLKLSASGRKLVAAKYSWDKCLENYRILLNR